MHDIFSQRKAKYIHTDTNGQTDYIPVILFLIQGMVKVKGKVIPGLN
jgi:hypothetical protein